MCYILHYTFKLYLILYYTFGYVKSDVRLYLTFTLCLLDVTLY